MNHAEDLELARLGHRRPRGVAVAAERLEGDALLHRQVPREQGTARRDPRPASDGSHRDARVLQLSGAVPGEGLGGRNLREAHRVKDLAAGLGASALHIGDAHANAGGSGWRDARRERRAVEGDAVDGEGEHGYLGSWRQSVRPLE